MKATYYTHMGSDDMVVDMARASFGRIADQFTAEQNAGLINFLARGMSSKERKAILEEAAATQDLDVLEECFKRMNAQTHWAPLAHPQITLFMEVPIFVARQDFKHIVGFVRSETSRRYVDAEPVFHQMEWRLRPEGSIKQGSAGPHPEQGSLSNRSLQNQRYATQMYEDMLKDGVAPEQARAELPQSMLVTYYTTGSLAAWARAFNQRIDSHAQVEIQELYKQVGEIIAPLYPMSWKALTN